MKLKLSLIALSLILISSSSYAVDIQINCPSGGVSATATPAPTATPIPTATVQPSPTSIVGGNNAFTGTNSFALGISVAAGQQIQLNGTDYPTLVRNENQTNPGLIVETKNGTFNGMILEAAANDAFNWALANPSTPTLFITGETQNTTHWVSITHNDTNGVIKTGTGLLDLSNQAVMMNTALTAASTPQIQWATGLGFSTLGSATALYFISGSTPMNHLGSVLYTVSGGSIGFSSNTDASVALPDSEFVRSTAGVIKVTDGSGSTNGWFAQPAAYGYVTGDVTNSTATLANVTGAVVTLKASRNYSFEVTLHISNSTAAEGVKLDFNAGGVTATNFMAMCIIENNNTITATTRLTALNTSCNTATLTGNGVIKISGVIEVNAAGTLQIEAAENSHSTGTLTVSRGSLLYVTDISS